MVRASYYGSFDVQYSAAGGRTTVRADRALGDEILQAAARFRRIDEDVYTNRIAPRLLDGGPVVAKSEEPLVRLLDSAARDGRVVATIRGQRVRFTPGAKRLYEADRATITLRRVEEAEYQRIVAQRIESWYLSYLDRSLAEDPEGYSREARDRDRARAEEPGAFRFDEPAGRPEPFTITPARPESIDFYRGRSFLTRDGERVPAEEISLHELHFDPELAGQMLTALFAFDRRSGELLRMLELHE